MGETVWICPNCGRERKVEREPWTQEPEWVTEKVACRSYGECVRYLRSRIDSLEANVNPLKFLAAPAAEED